MPTLADLPDTPRFLIRTVRARLDVETVWLHVLHPCLVAIGAAFTQSPALRTQVPGLYLGPDTTDAPGPHPRPAPQAARDSGLRHERARGFSPWRRRNCIRLPMPGSLTSDFVYPDTLYKP